MGKKRLFGLPLHLLTWAVTTFGMQLSREEVVYKPVGYCDCWTFTKKWQLRMSGGFGWIILVVLSNVKKKSFIASERCPIIFKRKIRKKLFFSPTAHLLKSVWVVSKYASSTLYWLMIGPLVVTLKNSLISTHIRTNVPIPMYLQLTNVGR